MDRELRTLLVASAAPGDGKTTVARHLAAAAARMGARVLLLEADLRRPTVAQQLDVLSGPGVSDVLIGAVSLSEGGTVVKPGTSGVGSFSGRMRLRHRGLYRALVKVSDGAHVSDYSEPILVR